MLKAGSHAAQACEPRQIREEATVNRYLWVPWESLARVMVRDTLKKSSSMGGARSLMMVIIYSAFEMR